MQDKYPYNLINKIYHILQLRDVEITDDNIKGLEYMIENRLSNIQKLVIKCRYLDELSIVSTAKKLEEETGCKYTNSDVAKIESQAIRVMAHTNNTRWLYFGYSHEINKELGY